MRVICFLRFLCLQLLSNSNYSLVAVAFAEIALCSEYYQQQKLTTQKIALTKSRFFLFAPLQVQPTSSAIPADLCLSAYRHGDRVYPIFPQPTSLLAPGLLIFSRWDKSVRSFRSEIASTNFNLLFDVIARHRAYS